MGISTYDSFNPYLRRRLVRRRGFVRFFDFFDFFDAMFLVSSMDWTGRARPGRPVPRPPYSRQPKYDPPGLARTHHLWHKLRKLFHDFFDTRFTGVLPLNQCLS